MDKYKLAPIISALLLTVLASIVILSLTPSVVAADNAAPEVVAIQADDNLVNRWGDNVEITFQVHDENGWEDIKSVEIFIKNHLDGLEKYENLTGDGDNISPYDNEYSYIFNPDENFEIGWATLEVKAIDNAGNKNTVTKENLFRVTDADIKVTTENADNITDNSATLHASIDLAGYDKVEACFYYENGTGHATLENQTDWENTSETDYEKAISGLEPYENYEFRASIRLPASNPDGASQFDNGSILKFITLTDTPPSVDTKENASNVKLSSATIHGELLQVNWENAEVWFQKKASGGSWENTNKKVLTGPDNFAENLTNLKSNTTYKFRAVASNPAGEDLGSIENFKTPIENASVKTKDATEIKRGNATLNASIDYGDYGSVKVLFYYREEEQGWDNTGWENISTKNYSKTIGDLDPGTIYEFYPKIKFGGKHDNGSILSFDSGQVLTRFDHALEVETDATENIQIEIMNEYDNKVLRNVVVDAREERYPKNSITIETIQSDSSSTATFEFNPENTGEQKLGFSIEYRVYDGDNYLFSRSKDIETSILVTGAEYENAIAIRIASESAREGEESSPGWIFYGETYKAQIEIQNQRAVAVTGVRIVIENGRDYGVGTLQADESETVEIRIPPENYELGTTNEYVLRAIHERGVSPSLTIKFGARSENAPVAAYLTRSNSPIHEGQDFEFTIVVAGAPDSKAKNLELIALSENVVPEGYYLGEEMKNLVQQEVSTAELGEALMPMPSVEVEEEGEEEEKKEEGAVIGRALNFRAMNLSPGDNALKFRITYELGNRLVQKEFEVDFEVYGSSDVKLIQAEKVAAIKGEEAVISLQVYNGLGDPIKNVHIVPLENSCHIYPTDWVVGEMKPDAFLGAEFTVDTDELEDGDELSFQVRYDVGNKTFREDPINVTVNLNEPSRNLTPYYAISGIIVLVLLILYWRRR